MRMAKGVVIAKKTVGQREREREREEFGSSEVQGGDGVSRVCTSKTKTTSFYVVLIVDKT